MKRKLSLVLTVLLMLLVMTSVGLGITANAADSTTEYTITYHLDGGTNALKNPDVYTSEDVITLKDATKFNHYFGGWFLDPEMTEEISVISNRSGNLNLYAMFTPKNYTATFNDNGATSSSELILTLNDSIGTTKKVHLNNGDEINPYSYWIPTRSGYVFAGWYYGTEYVHNTYNITTNMTLYAKWVQCAKGKPVIFGESTVSGTSKSVLTRIEFKNYNSINLVSAIENVNSGNITAGYKSISPDSCLTDRVTNTVGNIRTTDYKQSKLYVYVSGEYTALAWDLCATPSSWQQEVSFYITDLTQGTSIYRGTTTSFKSGSVNIKPGTLLEIEVLGASHNGYGLPTNWYLNLSLGGFNGTKIVPTNERTLKQVADGYINAPIVSKTGYDFLGWYDASGNEMTETWKYTEDQTFTAKWQKARYTITYNLDGGTNSTSNPLSYTAGSTITLVNPSKTGYTFKGWYSDSDFKTKVTNITSAQAGNITLYAKWAANSYNLTLDANNGVFAPKVTFISDGSTIKECYLYEQDILTAYRPTNKSGYIFAGWYKDASFTTLFKFNGPITGDVTLYAKWIECSCNIINIESTDNLEVDIAGRNEQFYAFVPLVDGTIVVTSSSDDLDLYGTLYDSSLNELIESDDISDDNLDFIYTYNVTAGKLYYISVKGNTASTVGDATVSIDWTGACTITGGTYFNSQVVVVYDTQYKLPQSPILEGYIFLGWFDENGIQVTDGTWNFVTDKTLTAKWKEVENHSHSYGDWNPYDEAQHIRECECGEKEYANHNWNGGETTTSATHTTAGVKTYTCIECGETKTEEITPDVDNHTYGTWGKYDKDNHVRTCGCGHKEYESHNWDNGVTANGVITFTCTTCGEKVTQTVRPDPTGSITVKNAKAFVGKTIAVDIVLADNPGFVNMQLKIEYDSSVFTLDSVTDGGILGTSMHTSRYESPYYLTWDNGSTATADITANGTIATLNFTVAADAPTGDYEIKVSYDYDNYGVVDFYLNPVSIATVNGSVTVTDVILGDVTGDGRVNTLDGMYLGRYLAKWPDFTAEKIDMDAADVNGDGKVNTLDGMILGRHLAKWPGYETLPFGK